MTAWFPAAVKLCWGPGKRIAHAWRSLNNEYQMWSKLPTAQQSRRPALPGPQQRMLKCMQALWRGRQARQLGEAHRSARLIQAGSHEFWEAC